MAKNKKRPQYVQEIVDDINEIFYHKKEKNAHCDLAIWLDHYLLKKGMYRGYNLFIDKTHTDGKTDKVLAGSADPNVYEYIQIY